MITLQGNLSAAVAPAGTFTISNASPGVAFGGLGHVMELNQAKLVSPTNFSIALTSGTITVTNNTASTWPIGASYFITLNSVGDATGRFNLSANNPANPLTKFAGGVVPAQELIVNMGSPVVASTTVILSAATGTGSINLLATAYDTRVTGALYGRGVQIVSSSASDTAVVVTITGTDCYGVTLTQALTTNGTTAVLSTKTFTTVTSVVASATMVGTLSVGTTAALGLPVVLNEAAFIENEFVSGVNQTTNLGTFVAADNTAAGPTSATGDVRGTYTPNSANVANGVRAYQLLGVFPDVNFSGEVEA